MAERIQVPPTLMGDTKTQLNQIYQYLYRVSEVLNRNLQLIGDNGLTEREQAALRGVTDTEAQSMKDMVVALAEETARLSGRLSDAEQKIRNLNNTTQNAYTDETDLNNVTDQGTYWLEIYAMTNKPSQLTTAGREYALMVLAEDEGAEVSQVIFSSGSIYIRMKHNGSWNSWSRLQPAT